MRFVTGIMNGEVVAQRLFDTKAITESQSALKVEEILLLYCLNCQQTLHNPPSNTLFDIPIS